MKVVALVSGGKDSCYAAMKCVAYGHQLVALANLKPVSSVDDADSYMYQTVGHEVIEAYSECLGIPLVRLETKAKLANSDMAYEPTAGDEVEDLYQLLSIVKCQYPEVQAVTAYVPARKKLGCDTANDQLMKQAQDQTVPRYCVD